MPKTDEEYEKEFNAEFGENYSKEHPDRLSAYIEERKSVEEEQKKQGLDTEEDLKKSSEASAKVAGEGPANYSTITIKDGWKKIDPKNIDKIEQKKRKDRIKERADKEEQRNLENAFSDLKDKYADLADSGNEIAQRAYKTFFFDKDGNEINSLVGVAQKFNQKNSKNALSQLEKQLDAYYKAPDSYVFTPSTNPVTPTGAVAKRDTPAVSYKDFLKKGFEELGITEDVEEDKKGSPKEEDKKGSPKEPEKDKGPKSIKDVKDILYRSIIRDYRNGLFGNPYLGVDEKDLTEEQLKEKRNAQATMRTYMVNSIGTALANFGSSLQGKGARYKSDYKKMLESQNKNLVDIQNAIRTASAEADAQIAKANKYYNLPAGTREGFAQMAQTGISGENQEALARWLDDPVLSRFGELVQASDSYTLKSKVFSNEKLRNEIEGIIRDNDLKKEQQDYLLEQIKNLAIENQFKPAKEFTDVMSKGIRTITDTINAASSFVPAVK